METGFGILPPPPLSLSAERSRQRYRYFAALLFGKRCANAALIVPNSQCSVWPASSRNIAGELGHGQARGLPLTNSSNRTSVPLETESRRFAWLTISSF